MTLPTTIDTAGLIELCGPAGSIEVVLAGGAAVHSWTVGFVRAGGFHYGSAVAGQMLTAAELVVPRSARHEITFTVAGRAELGTFLYADSSPDFFQEFALDVKPALNAIQGPVRATLSVEDVSYIAKHGPRKGRRVEYVKPVLEVLGGA